jgi:hypothetical protein
MFKDITDYNAGIGLNPSKFNANDNANIVGGIISALLPYVLTIAGLILFGMLIAGGFSMLTAAADPKKAESGQQLITNAIIGFIIIFTAYWLTQILEIVLGISIL